MMKKYIIPYILFICVGMPIGAFSQKKAIQDTVYYLVDLDKIPTRDRMITKGKEGPYQSYTIACPCLKYNRQPLFLFPYANSKSRIISKRQLNANKKLVDLSTLIKKVKEYANSINTLTDHIY